MRAGYRVVNFTGFGRVMVGPNGCDACKRVEVVTPTEVGTCAFGDELDGCDQLATRVAHEPGWAQLRRRGSEIDEDYCPGCVANGTYDAKCREAFGDDWGTVA